MRYRLRTLLILLAIGPPVLAGGYLAWDRLRPKPSPWLTDEDFKPFFLPANKPGFTWNAMRHGLVEVPIKELSESGESAVPSASAKLSDSN